MPDYKPKKCKDCKEEFQPFKFAQPRCVPCAISRCGDDAKKAAAKSFNKETKRRKEKLKGKSEWKKEAQTAFNAFIRARDSELPCISCDRMPNDNNLATGSRWDAGHYRSRGATPELSFNEDNCHKQCVYCNRSLSGNVANYRIGLSKKIGDDRLAIVEGPHDLTRHTIEDYKEIKSTYKAKLKELTLQ